MPTNEERRNLAQNMRGGYDVTWNSNGLFWLNGTLFGMDICARSEEKIRNGLRHLAAFIDPEPELTCEFKKVSWDDGQCTWGCKCSACGHRFEHETGITWNFCPHCGAKVVDE